MPARLSYCLIYTANSTLLFTQFKGVSFCSLDPIKGIFVNVGGSIHLSRLCIKGMANLCTQQPIQSTTEYWTVVPGPN